LDNDLESGPLPGLNPALTNMGEEIDTPTLFTALFPSLDPSQEPAVRCGCSNYLYMGRCSSCRAKGNKGRPKAACPAQGKICYNCNIQGHFGRVCTTQSNLHLVMNGGPTKQTLKEECLGFGAWGARMHARGACLVQDKKCHYCGVSGHFERMCMRLNRGSPKKILHGPQHRRLRQVGKEDDPKSDMRLLISGIGLDQLTTSFCGLVSEGRDSGMIEFGVAECHNRVTGHKTEQGALSTNMWPNLGGDIWQPGTAADDKYGFYRKSTLSGVCSGRYNDYEIDLGLKSLGETTVGGAMALPEVTGVTTPPRITC
jgi:hypothetical protein